jgi:PAS domain S-box-containing protein
MTRRARARDAAAPNFVSVAWAALLSLRDARRSVRGKLVGAVLLTTIIVLLVSGGAILLHDLSVYRSTWASDLATEANILSVSTAPALAFDDRKVAAHDLAALQARPRVRAAAIYTADGRLFVSYVQADEPPLPATAPEFAREVTVRGERVEIAQGISYNGEFLGTIYLRARYDLAGRIQAYVGIFALITALSLVLALVLSASLQRAITLPLEVIAEVARQIVERRDYSLRVARTTDDEIGIVVQALNDMLNEVQLRTQALEQSNAALTEEVAVRQAAEAALARANTRLESTMAAAEIGGWTWAPGTGELIADRNFAALYGLRDESLLSADPALRRRGIHAEDLATVDAAESAALRSGTLASTEFRIVQPDGSVRWVIGRGKVQFDADGAPTLLAGLLIDVTAQKQAEQERRDSEKVYRAIGESIDYGVWLCDAEGRNTYASESFLRLTGMSQQQCSEFGWGEMLHPDDAPATLAAWLECVRSGQAWYREHRIRGIDGIYHAILAQGVPVRREDGTIYCWAGINLDISRMKRTEEALREADRRKDEFLATLAHELRNPLAPIRHATQLLGMAAATDAQRQWGREVIARQVQHMALLLEDLLDVSRISRGRLDLKKEYVGLARLVDAAVEMARPLIDAKRHTLQVELPAEPVQLNVDPLRISQALCNLLTNAAKYTDAEGRIVLAAELGQEGLSISVVDNGIGLTASAIPRVFEMFSQIESALERSQGGLGIGLALARGLVGLHGGSVEAFSEGPGRGSTFVLRLPAAVLVAAMPAAAAAAARSESSGPSSCSVLIADDNRDAADSLALLLGLQGYEVLLAYNGREALELAQVQRPQVLILDIGMPESSGYEVARRVREEAWGRAALLVALTGWGQQEDMDRAHSAGFDRHFSKPVDLEELMSCLTAWRARQGRAEGGAGATED